MTSKSHRRALWLLVLPLTFAAQTASTAADDGQQAEANDVVTPAAEVQAANTGERAAVDIRAFVQARAAERVEAAQAGDAEALSALLVADDDLISMAANVQVAGSELDTIQFEHRESIDEYRDAKDVLDLQLATLYAIGPVRSRVEFDGSSVLDAVGRTILLDSVFAASEQRVLDAYLATELAVDVEALAESRIQAEAVLAELRAKRLDALQTAEATAAELERLAALPDDVVFPVAGDYNFVDTFLAPRMYGTPDAHRHQGTDVFAPAGTPLVATERGIVVRIGEIRLGGLRLWLIGESGTHYYYAHLSGFADVTEGQFVEAGTELGYVGNTGNAINTPPHLHIQVHPGGGRAVNPYPLLRQLADRDAELAEQGLAPLGLG